MTKKTLLKTIFCGGVIFALVFLGTNTTKAGDCEDSCEATYPETYTDYEDARKNCENECKDIRDKEKEVLKLLKINDKTQNTLHNQLENIDQQQSRNHVNLSSVQNELGTLSQQIENLKRDIAEKEKSINYQKQILAGLMRSYYEYDQQGLLSIVLLNEDLSNSLAQADYIEQSGVKANDVLAEIKETQGTLEQSRQKLEGDYKESDGLKQKLQYEKSNLQSTENQKQYLLTKTQGEEEKYQQMLANIENQKKQLFDFGSVSNIGALLGSVSGYDQPDKDDRLSTSWYFSQRDSRWKGKKIGVSNYKMEDWGCAVSSVAMMYTYYGNKSTPKDVLQEANFAGALIYWPKSWKDTGYGYTNYKSKLNEILKDDDIAIIHIHVSGGGHFLIVGGKDDKDYIVHDPYFGSNLYLSTSLSLMKKSSGGSAYVDRIIYK